MSKITKTILQRDYGLGITYDSFGRIPAKVVITDKRTCKEVFAATAEKLLGMRAEIRRLRKKLKESEAKR